MLLAGHVLGAVSPVFGFSLLAFERHHFESLVALQARTYVNTVAATEAVHHVNLLYKVHTLHGGGCLHVDGLALEALELVVGQYEGTDSSVRTNKVALVTLYTVLLVPYGHEGCHTALFVSGSALLPSTIFRHLECAHGQKVAVLCIDGAYHV